MNASRKCLPATPNRIDSSIQNSIHSPSNEGNTDTHTVASYISNTSRPILSAERGSLEQRAAASNVLFAATYCDQHDVDSFHSLEISIDCSAGRERTDAALESVTVSLLRALVNTSLPAFGRPSNFLCVILSLLAPFIHLS